GELLQSEILVLAGSIEDDIAFPHSEEGRNLRHAGHMHPEVAEHFVRRPAGGMTLHAPALAEENECAFLLRSRQGAQVAPGKAIERRIGENQSEFKLGN